MRGGPPTLGGSADSSVVPGRRRRRDLCGVPIRRVGLGPAARGVGASVPPRARHHRSLGAFDPRGADAPGRPSDSASIGLLFKTEGRLAATNAASRRRSRNKLRWRWSGRRLFEAERQARDSTERLQALAASLAASATRERGPDDPGPGGRRHRGAPASWAAIVDTGAQVLDAVAGAGATRRRDRTVPPHVPRSRRSPRARPCARPASSGSTRSRRSPPRIRDSRVPDEGPRWRVRLCADVRCGRLGDRRRVVPDGPGHDARRHASRRGAGGRRARRPGARAGAAL